jgi:hypothetical protein
LIARVLALSLLATGSEEIPAAAEHGLLLELDACLQVDEPSVQNLVELELRDARARSGNIPISVVVRCLDGAQEIRVEPWASRGDDGIRTIALPDAEDATATLEARSRELALAIAELIRRLEITRPLEPPPPPPPPPPPIVVAPPSPSEAPPGRWGSSPCRRSITSPAVSGWRAATSRWRRRSDAGRWARCASAAGSRTARRCPRGA